MKSSNTTREQRKMPGGVTGKGFVKGDPRINRNGRPKSFDQVRALAQEIAHETIQTKSGSKISVIEAILRKWAMGGDPMREKAFVEYSYGKVPDKIEGEVITKTLHLHYDHEGRNGDRTRIPSSLPSGAN